jgi:hypothetical protein
VSSVNTILVPKGTVELFPGFTVLEKSTINSHQLANAQRKAVKLYIKYKFQKLAETRGYSSLTVLAGRSEDRDLFGSEYRDKAFTPRVFIESPDSESRWTRPATFPYANTSDVVVAVDAYGIDSVTVQHILDEVRPKVIFVAILSFGQEGGATSEFAWRKDSSDPRMLNVRSKDGMSHHHFYPWWLYHGCTFDKYAVSRVGRVGPYDIFQISADAPELGVTIVPYSDELRTLTLKGVSWTDAFTAFGMSRMTYRAIEDRTFKVWIPVFQELHATSNHAARATWTVATARNRAATAFRTEKKWHVFRTLFYDEPELLETIINDTTTYLWESGRLQRSKLDLLSDVFETIQPQLDDPFSNLWWGIAGTAICAGCYYFKTGPFQPTPAWSPLSFFMKFMTVQGTGVSFAVSATLLGLPIEKVVPLIACTLGPVCEELLFPCLGDRIAVGIFESCVQTHNPANVGLHVIFHLLGNGGWWRKALAIGAHAFWNWTQIGHLLTPDLHARVFGGGPLLANSSTDVVEWTKSIVDGRVGSYNVRDYKQLQPGFKIPAREFNPHGTIKIDLTSHQLTPRLRDGSVPAPPLATPVATSEWPLIVSGFILPRPANTPRMRAAMLALRILPPPPYASNIYAWMALYEATVRNLQRAPHNGVVVDSNSFPTPPEVLADLAKKAPSKSKRTMLIKLAIELRQGHYSMPANPANWLQVKGNETLKTKEVEGEAEMLARPINAVDPRYNYQYWYMWKLMAGRFFAHSDWVYCGKICSLTYLVSYDPELLTRWFRNEYQRVAVGDVHVAIIVVGDDSIAIRATDQGMTVICNDFSKFDRSQTLASLCYMRDILLAGGADPKAVEMWWTCEVGASWLLRLASKGGVARLEGLYPPFNLRILDIPKWEQMIYEQYGIVDAAQYCYGMTGSSGTSTRNSLFNAHVSAVAHSASDSYFNQMLPDLAFLYAGYGFSAKLAAFRIGEGFDFLHMLYIPGDIEVGGEFFPGPELILKLGKVLQDPLKIWKDCDARTAYRRLCWSMGNCFGNVPRQYPILGPLLARYRAVGLQHSDEIFSEENWVRQRISRRAEQWTDVRKWALPIICDKYNLTVGEVVAYEKEVSRAVPPCLVPCPFASNLAFVGYGLAME